MIRFTNSEINELLCHQLKLCSNRKNVIIYYQKKLLSIVWNKDIYHPNLKRENKENVVRICYGSWENNRG